MDLYDADLATVSDLATRRRASTTIEDALGRLYASTLGEYMRADHADDFDAKTAVILEAIALDQANPEGPRLMDEIRAIRRLRTPQAA